MEQSAIDKRRLDFYDKKEIRCAHCHRLIEVNKDFTGETHCYYCYSEITVKY